MDRKLGLTAEQLAEDVAAAKEEDTHESAKGGLSAAYRIVNLRKIDASQRLGADHEITKAYERELKGIKALEQRVIHFDETAYVPAFNLAKDIYKKYGKKKIGELKLEDHTLPKQNGPK